MPDETKPAEPRARRMVVDPEVQAMNDVAETLDSLPDDGTRQRVVMWAGLRYGVCHYQMPLASKPPGGPNGGPAQ